MKKSFLIFLVLSILSTPLVILGVINILQIRPENNQSFSSSDSLQEDAQSAEKPENKMTVIPNTPINPSTSFMNGYWDGWHGKWLGPIRWTLNDEYRQGHMLGSYDRKKGIDDRYPKK